jgi:hypothetical protein
MLAKRFTVGFALMAAAAFTQAHPAAGQLLDDKLTIHGSLNAAVGKSSDHQVIGIGKDGTSDYRIMTLQLRYKVSDQDYFVAQILNRRIGVSPLKDAVGDLSTQWAFWQHNHGDFTFKAGRSPLPRGLTNEVRYIGTVIPFFRVSEEYTSDAFDAVDGVIFTARHSLAPGSHAFYGGVENRSVRATSTGLTLRISKGNNAIGGQTTLNAPGGVKLVAYGDTYERLSEVPFTRGRRQHWIAAGEVDRGFAVARGEYQRETGYGPSSNLNIWYWQGVVRLNEKWHVGVEHTIERQRLFIALPAHNADVYGTNSTGGVVDFHLTPMTVLKLEHHLRSGYNFEDFVPSNVVNGANVTLLPVGRTNYSIASIAISF